MDIVIYALIAAFFAWRLFASFGTHHEDGGRSTPFAGSAPGKPGEKDLLALPLELPAPKSKEPLALAAIGPAPQSLSGSLAAIAKAEPGFDEKAFVKGAKLAFEVIVHAFAASEREALKPLVSPVLFEAFSKAIDAQEASGAKSELALLNVIEAHILRAEVKDNYGYITMEFTSDQKRTVSAGGAEKVPQATHRLHDIWTFRRALGASDPNWMLVETRTV